MKDNQNRWYTFLRIGMVQGADAVTIPKHLFKKWELVKFPTCSPSPRLQSTETDQLELLRKLCTNKSEEDSMRKSCKKAEAGPWKEQTKGQHTRVLLRMLLKRASPWANWSWKWLKILQPSLQAENQIPRNWYNVWNVPSEDAFKITLQMLSNLFVGIGTTVRHGSPS